MPTSSEIATLLAETAWLTRLARSLTGDAAEADDAVQETFVAALRSPPDAERPPRPWLRRVLVNAIRMRRRGRTRQTANDAVVEPEPAAAPDHLLDRARLERRITKLVLELEEPYCSTVLLRYREGLTAEAIARQQGIPAGTVRRRLKTALDRLRRELDDREGPAVWRAALLPLSRSSASSIWRIAMAKVSFKVIVVAALLLLFAIGAWRWRAGGSAPPARTRRAAVVDIVREAAAPAMFAQPGVGERMITGHVIERGVPYAGATVRLTHAITRETIAEVRTGIDGAFTLGVRAADRYVVTAVAPDRTAAPVVVDLRAPKTLAVELRLTGCEHLVGTVREGSGVPIRHVQVARDDAPWPVAETDATGHYDLCVRLGPVTARYTASGYRGALAKMTVQSRTVRDVVLVPEAVVAGSVVTADGAPVPSAWVTIEPPSMGAVRDAPQAAFTEADGTFRIASVAAGRNYVWAVAPGLVSRRMQIIVGVGQVLEGLVVRAERGARITGVVTMRGAPVIGVGVGMAVGNHNTEGVLAVTQADGSFTIDRAPRGDISLIVDGYTVVAPKAVRTDRDVVHVEVAVEPRARLVGRVIRHGTPVPDALVKCPTTEAVHADGNGAYACEGQMPGTYTMTVVDSDDHWGLAEHVGLVAGQTTTLDVELAYDAMICGVATDEAGAPLPSVQIHALETKTGDAGADTTDTDGSFCTKYLTGHGSYAITAFTADVQLQPISPIAPVALGDGRTDIRVAFVAPRMAIAGAVSDPSGAPLADVLVRADPATVTGTQILNSTPPATSAITDAAGHFEIGRLAAGSYALLATGRDGGARRIASVAAGTHDVAITLDAAGRIAGTLVGFSSAPVITCMDKTGGFEMIDMEVDGDGFRASGMSPGTYILTASGGDDEGDAKTVTVRAGQTTSVTMTSAGTAQIVAHVREWTTRAPIVGTMCDGVPRDGNDVGGVYTPVNFTTTDASGTCAFRAPAGELLVATSKAFREVVAPAGGTLDVDVFEVDAGYHSTTIDARLEFMVPRVEAIVHGGVAEQAGLAVGDIIVAVDGASVAELDPGSIMALIVGRPPSSVVALTLQRGTAQAVRSVTIRSTDR